MFGTVTQPDGTLGPLRAVSYAEAIDETMRLAIQWGAHRLTDPVFADLEEHVAAYILKTMETLDAR